MVVYIDGHNQSGLFLKVFIADLIYNFSKFKKTI